MNRRLEAHGYTNRILPGRWTTDQGIDGMRHRLASLPHWTKTPAAAASSPPPPPPPNHTRPSPLAGAGRAPRDQHISGLWRTASRPSRPAAAVFSSGHTGERLGILIHSAIY